MANDFFFNFDDWSPVMKFFGAIGAAAAGAAAWMFGRRSKAAEELPQAAKDAIAKAASLQAKLDTLEIRDDFGKVIEATRRSLEDEIQKLRDENQSMRERLMAVEFQQKWPINK